MDRCDPQELSISNFRGHILHSEGWLAGYIKDIIAYPPELLNFFEQVIAGSFEDIFHEILDADPFWATEIARRFANGDLTPQEAEALRKLLLAIRIKGGNTTRLMKKLMIAIMNFLASCDEIEVEEAIELVPGTIETLRDDYMSSTVDDYKSGDSTSRLGAAGALLLVLKHGCLDKDAVQKVKEAYPLPHLDMVAAHHELVEHQPKKLEEKLSKFVPKLFKLHEGISLARIESEEDAKSDDLKCIALSLVKDYDIYNLHKDELTHDLFTDTKSRSTFDKLLRSYNNNAATLRIKLMNFTPDTAPEERRWRTTTAGGAAILDGLGLTLKNVNEEIRIKKVDQLGPFSDAGWKKGDKIMFINERRYTSYEHGLCLLKTAKERGASLTLTVLCSD